MNEQLDYINNQSLVANPLNVLVPKIYFISIEKISLSYNDLELHHNHDFGVFTTKLYKVVWGIIVAYCYN